MTAINFEVLIAVGFKPRTSQLYTPVFCATEGNVQHSSLCVGTKYPLFNPSEGVENVQPSNCILCLSSKCTAFQYSFWYKVYSL